MAENIYDNYYYMSDYQWIIDNLPYSEPFRFVEDIQSINDEGVVGTYTFHKEHDFYRGHFKGNPVTPGVILTECMAQIGVVSLGIYLLKNNDITKLKIGLTSISADYYVPVLPGERVRVESEKTYFRFNKLKCQCKMFNEVGKLVCKAEIAGMMKIETDD